MEAGDGDSVEGFVADLVATAAAAGAAAEVLVFERGDESGEGRGERSEGSVSTSLD